MEFYKNASAKVKKQIIELGTHIYQYIIRSQIEDKISIECAENSLNEDLTQAKRLLTEALEKNNEWKEKLEEAKREKWDITENLKQAHQQELTTIRERLESSFCDISKFKDDTIKRLQKELVSVRQETETRYNRLIQEKDTRIREYRELYERERIKQEQVTKVNTKSVTRGALGQNECLSMLEEHWNNDWLYEDCSKKPEYMDFCATNHIFGICGGLEMKLFTSDVNKRDITKFQRDAALREQYQFGILFSITSGVSCRDDFHVELCEKTHKPLIYVSRVRENPLILRVVESFLKYWFHHDLNSINDIDYKKHLIELFKSQFKLQTDIIKRTEKTLNMMKQNITSMSEQFGHIFNQNLESIEDRTNPEPTKSTNNTSILKKWLQKRVNYSSNPLHVLDLKELWFSVKEQIDIFPQTLNDDKSKKSLITKILKEIIRDNNWQSKFNTRKRIITNLVFNESVVENENQIVRRVCEENETISPAM